MTPEPGSTELWKITLGELDEKMGVKIVEESVERVVRPCRWKATGSPSGCCTAARRSPSARPWAPGPP